ncbi:MAG: acetate--CoA ligase family protein [Alphaproteobacteria bacterium]|nr:acetate--CoA ligase family protein [Alphaproteobacteria bacterium]MBU1515410.1 acetate--CoA ligase family protein [Alphaproteobacteria bacterium]MBU2092955.1 acetate--CoA ligase family protein [Alphaproteobacteria bacterium]MBU2153587.1 acetate--CoA ligase family protein [Alphaproteobacteria bacterium]MBU2309900.1 acetate--CoA ligase family protein [Alphaproteobacteria bacterium]
MNAIVRVEAQSRPLGRLLKPQSIAIIGASNRIPGIGGYCTANVKRAFSGPIYPVNPRESEIQGLKAYASIADLPRDIDLAIVVVPADGVAPVLEACAAQGVGGVVIITSGFAEVGGPGVGLQAQVAEILARTGLRAIGPNCIGFMNLTDGVMANFVLDPTDPLPGGGPVALVSQSGGLGGYMVRKALTAGLNLGWFVSTGNEVDASVSAILRELVEREDVRVLLGAFEALRDPELFIDTALRAQALDKPFIVLKAGRSEEAAIAAQAHTGSMVGSAEAFDAVCRQYGIFSVASLEEMLDLGVIFQGGRRAKGRRVGIITGSGGAGVILADACMLEGLKAPALPAADQAMLLELMPKPFMGSVANPVDVTAQALGTPGTFEAVLTKVPATDAVDMIAPVIIGNPLYPDMYIRSHSSTEKPVAFVSTLLPTTLLNVGVPAYTDPRRAAHALAAMADYSLATKRTQRPKMLPADPARTAAARAILAAPHGSDTLMEVDSKALLALYGAPVTREVMCRSADEAVAAATTIGGKVALKVMSYALPHKSDVGGVRLGLSGDDDVRAGYAGLLADVARHAPDAKIEGVLVQEMAPARLEILCGMTRDPVFGPIVAVGLGGVMVEILGQAALLPAPFEAADVKAALEGLLGGRLLSSSRGLQPSELDAIARLAVALGQAALELPEIAEIDVNPVRVANGVALAADALIVVSGAAQ